MGVAPVQEETRHGRCAPGQEAYDNLSALAEVHSAARDSDTELLDFDFIHEVVEEGNQ